MAADRFKNFNPEVRELVLAFERQRGGGGGFFDADQLEIIADFYLELYDIEGLRAAVEYGERLFPDNDAVRLRRAHLLCVQGAYPQALALLKELERAEPENTDVCYALGTLYSMTDHAAEAIAYYLKAAADGYELGMIYGNIADEHYKLGQTEEAVRYYRMSIENNPDEERALYNLACTWDEQGMNEVSERFFSQHVEEHPYSKGGWYCLGCVYSWLSLDEKAADAYEYALAIDKTLCNAYFGLSDSYRHLGDTGRAVAALNDALDYADDRAYVLYSMGRIYFEAGNWHTASTYLHDALKEDPAYAVAWNDLGRCCEQMGYADEAAGYYRRAIDLEPDADGHWVCLADLYMKQGRFAEAASLLESARVEAEDPFLFDSRLLYCYYRLGRRNRLFVLLQRDARQYGAMYPTLLSQYPDLRQDAEIVSNIQSLSTE